MRTKNTSVVPVEVELVRQRFERWREERTPGTPIPQALWTAAGKVAQRHGVTRTTRTLGLDYHKLKSLAQGAAAVKPVQFVELAPPVPGAQCRIEIEGASGARMRIELPAAASADLVLGLCQRVWGDSQ